MGATCESRLFANDITHKRDASLADGMSIKHLDQLYRCLQKNSNAHEATFNPTRTQYRMYAASYVSTYVR